MKTIITDSIPYQVPGAYLATYHRNINDNLITVITHPSSQVRFSLNAPSGFENLKLKYMDIVTGPTWVTFTLTYEVPAWVTPNTPDSTL